MAAPGDPSKTVVVDGIARLRREVVKEIELVLEAKKNSNAILTTMYSVFFAIEGGLVLSFYLVNSLTAAVGIAVFGELTILCLALVTVRSRATNNNCDQRAVALERAMGMRVVSNYVPEPGKPLSGLVRVHATLLIFDLVVLGLWPFLVLGRYHLGF